MTLRRMFRKLTRDRTNKDPPKVKQILTVEQIGPRRSRTPEGFLLCESVPIKRIGVMVYGPGEVPIDVGPDGAAYVSRSADELFRPETIASYMGKPVVDEHPTDDVTPDNWAKLARGVTLNVRQGSGEDADVLLADLLITDAGMIRDINAMKREVSAGYEADYEQTGPGEGVQTNIIGNHVALVERGRCGPRCAIGDHSPQSTRKLNMPTQKVTQTKTPATKRRQISQATLDALMEQLGEPDASTMDDGELTGPADSHTHIHIHGIGSTAPATQGAGAVNVTDEDPEGGTAGNASTLDPKTEARFASLENGHKEILAQMAALTAAVSGKGGSGGSDPSGKAADEDPDATTDENPFAKKDGDKDDKEEKKDDKGKTNDSAALETSYKDVLSGCEVLVPGFRVPTFDAKAARATTIDSMCAARRKALDAFATTNEGQQVLESVAGVKTVDTLSMACSNVAVLFRAAVGARKLMNNSAATQDANRLAKVQEPAKKKAPQTLADLNKAYREHYAKKH